MRKGETDLAEDS